MTLMYSGDPEEFQAVKALHALSSKVLAVAHTRIEGTWCAYIDAVPGWRHDDEAWAVLLHGEKLSEGVAKVLFPAFEGPYAH